MREWNLNIGDPLNLTLACDARLHKPDYFNDQIWEIRFVGNEPPGINVQTTFGLRAKSMRFFPRFTRQDSSISNPLDFSDKPHILAFYPNYISCIFSPFKGIKCLAEYWVPESHALAGRIQLKNETDLMENISLQWVALLNPLSEGENMNVYHASSGDYLKGKAANLIPVCILEGQPSSLTSPFPSLVHTFNLNPGETKTIKWASASLDQEDDSLELARKICSRAWDAEIAHVELINASQTVEISTGNPDWDAALAFSQKAAFSLLMSNESHSDIPPFILSRQPDHGYSIRKDGSDYPSPWKDQSLLDASYLADNLLPGAVNNCEEFIQYFVKQTNDYAPREKGLVPSPNQQPLLSYLVATIDRYKINHDWLTELFPQLFELFKSWFDHLNDKDQDGFPEWKNSSQTGLPDSPIYDLRNPNALGVNANFLESPAFASFLYQEGIKLTSISKKVHKSDVEKWLKQQTEKIQQSLENCWSPKSGLYHYRDYESHLSQKTQPVFDFRASGEFPIRCKLSPVQRLLVRLDASDQNTRAIIITIFGKYNKIPITEKIGPLDFSWFNGRAHYTSQNLYTRVDRIEVAGLIEGDKGSIQTVDTLMDDISLFLPLWATMPSLKHAGLMVENKFKPDYILPYGVPTNPDKSLNVTRLSMQWNAMILDGLLNYGFVDQASSIFTKLVEAVVLNLKKYNAFVETYDCFTAEPAGIINHLHGFLPIGLFLRILGVKYISSDCIILNGNNPFPWPVTLQYRGIKITSQTTDTIITFHTGQTITAKGPGPFEVRLS